MRNITTTFLLTSVIVLQCMIGCTGDPELNSTQYIERAKQRLKSGDAPAALIALRNALQLDASASEARWLLGKAYLRLGEGALAQRAFEKAESEGFHHAELNAAKQRALLLQGRFQLVLDQILEDSDNPALLTIRGEANLGVSDLKAGSHETTWRMAYVKIAEDLFQKALALDPKFYRAHLGMVRVALWRRDFDRAQEIIERASTLSPTNPGHWILQGMLGQMTRNPAAGEAAYRRALEVAPYDLLSKLNLVRVLLAQRKAEEALEHAEALVRRHPGLPTGRYLQAYALLQNDDLEGAHEVLKPMSIDFPDYFDGMLLLARVEANLGRLEQAFAIVSTLLAQDPENVPARRVLADIELKRGKPEVALSTLRSLPQRDFETLAMMGKAYHESGSPDRAERFAAKARLANPRRTTALELVASGPVTQQVEALISKGEYESAVDVAQRHLSQNEDDPQALFLAATAHLANGDALLARPALVSALALVPNSVPALLRLAEAESMASDVRAARARYEEVLQIEPMNTYALLNLARLESENDDPSSAQSHLLTLLGTEPENLAALIGLAKIARDSNDTQSMVGHLKRAAARNPHEVQPLLLLARHYVEVGNLREARTAIDAALSIKSSHPGALLLSSELEYATGDVDKSFATITQLAQRYPDQADIHRALALAHLRKADTTSARLALNRALEIDPAHRSSLTSLASLEMRLSNYAAADDAATRLIKLIPNRAVGFKIRGDALLAQQRFDDSIAQYDLALAAADGQQFMAQIVQAVRALSVEKAHALLRSRIARYPNEEGARLVLAGDYQRDGQVRDAIPIYEEIIERDENHLSALNNLSWLYHLQGDVKALKLAERAHRLQPNDAFVTDTLGWILLQQRDARALDLLRLAATQAPTVPTIRYHYALGLKRAGRASEAQTEFAAALRLGEFPEHDDAERELASMSPSNNSTISSAPPKPLTN